MYGKILIGLILSVFIGGIGVEVYSQKKAPVKQEDPAKEEQWFPPPLSQEEKEERIRKTEEIKSAMPLGIGKEKYVPEVLIKFGEKWGFASGEEAGPYELGIGEWGETGGLVDGPSDIKVDRFNNIYILDKLNARVLKYSNEGKFLKVTNVTRSKYHFDVDTDGNIYTLGFPHGFKEGHREHLCRLANLPVYSSSSDSGVSILFVEKHDSTGKWLGVNYFPYLHSWDRRNMFWPGGILAKRDSIYILALAGKTFSFKFSSSEELLKLTNISQGVLSLISEQFYSIEDRGANEVQLLKGKEKLNPIWNINLEMPVEFIQEDSKGNIYLSHWRDKRKVILKVNSHGEVVTSINNLPLCSNCKLLVAVSENGDDIYWLKYWACGASGKIDSGAELIKWHKEEK